MLADSVSVGGAILPKRAVHGVLAVCRRMAYGVLADSVSADGAVLPKRAEWKGFGRK